MNVYIFLYLVCIIISTVRNIHLSLGPYKLLSRNNTQEWYLNQTRKLNNSNKYCHICCMDLKSKIIGKNCGYHTMCIYPENISGPDCKGYIPVTLTEDEIAAVVDAHNTIRNLVALGLEERGSPGPQPTAANMRVMEWNAELALVAERWASQCLFSHDFCRDLAQYPVGQNIARGNFTNSNEIEFIRQWFETVQFYNSKQIDHYKKPKKENLEAMSYTQLVWADSYQIGCARSIYQQTSPKGLEYVENFICNYGPTGNIPNQPVYIQGKPCTFCPKGTGCVIDYPALCGSNLIWQLRAKDSEPDEVVPIPSEANSIFEKYFICRLLTLLYFLLLKYTINSCVCLIIHRVTVSKKNLIYLIN